MSPPNWLKYHKYPPVPDDAEERRSARADSLENLERAVRTADEVQPMAEMLHQHDQSNHYIARLALSYGGRS